MIWYNGWRALLIINIGKRVGTSTVICLIVYGHDKLSISLLKSGYRSKLNITKTKLFHSRVVPTNSRFHLISKYVVLRCSNCEQIYMIVNRADVCLPLGGTTGARGRAGRTHWSTCMFACVH